MAAGVVGQHAWLFSVAGVCTVLLVITGCGAQSPGTGSPAAASTSASPARRYAPLPSPPTYDPDPGLDEAAQADWESQTGEAWDLFETGYLEGWQTGCDDLFGNSPDGNFYENDVQYDVSDCEALAPVDASLVIDAPTDVPLDPESEGQQLGERDECRSLFDEQGVVSLNYGEDSYTADGDCP